MIRTEPPKDMEALRPMLSFSHLKLDTYPKLKSSFETMSKKFTQPSPIQAAVWPYLLSGKDCVGVAETGSGKTLAFSIPAMMHVLSSKENKSKGIKVVIVSPTRELAMQIYDVVEALCAGTGISSCCVYGGVPKYEQIPAVKRASLLVGTPGRLIDLIQDGSADLSKVNYLVLDEADRMLDKGFEEPIRQIFGACPPAASRQTLMFTATWPPSVRKLASTFMNSPARITIGDRGDEETGELRANTRIKQIVEVLEDPRAKERKLLTLLKEYDTTTKILVFCLYKKEAARVEQLLRNNARQNVVAIQGDMAQPARTASLNAFKSGQASVLVATDVAARGLDIPDVKLVVNLTFPLTIEDYVHRIGRTGRAGGEGTAITYFTEWDKDRAGALVNVLKKAGQTVPEGLEKWGGTVKKKGHAVYGAFFREVDENVKATKIKFDD
ncbi:DEAD-domain-containing protein [Ascobolus immersus RN42]|uniref:RNA helicase n=1 Tax=Ascobolus immersus RN42 TaxID=1160509 RepID=A0A3N4IEU1_ASCIM|nr:DEAD-domain-containing protein [Ascobolus immersus RN42]